MNTNLKRALKTTLYVALACLGSYVITTAVTDVLGRRAALLNPITSGFLHASADHFFSNILILFFCLIVPINKNYDITRIFWVTFLLSALYLPISISGITQPVIGISGTWCFLAGRYFFSWEKYKHVGIGIILAFATIELVSQAEHSGGSVGHLMHLFGIALGWVSLKYSGKIFPSWISTNPIF